MHVISRNAKRHLVDDHFARPSLQPPQHLQPSPVLFLPEILFQIGRLLYLADLRSCCLVCPAWHSVFSPFVDWTTLSYFDHYVRKANHQFRSRSDPGGSDLRQHVLEVLLQRITNPGAAFGIHRFEFTPLANRQLEYHRTDLDPCGSNEVKARQVDVICLIAEISKNLNSLHLNMNQKSDGQPQRLCSWTKALQYKTGIGSQTSSNGSGLPPAPPLSMTRHRIEIQNWPQLSSVVLQNCRLEYPFFQVLLGHAPRLKSVELLRVSFSEPGSMDTTSFSSTHETDSTIQFEQEGTLEQSEPNVNLEKSVIGSMSLWYVEGLKLSDVLQFASMLPLLSGLRCCLKEKTTEDPDVSSDQESPTTLGKFKSLLRLALHNSPCKDTASIFQRAEKGILYFSLLDSPVNEVLTQALQRSRHAGILREIDFKDVDLTACDHVLHLLLSSLPALELFCVHGAVMVCDPTILKRESWVCTNLKQLIAKPKCNGGGQDYSAQESQDEFMKQVASLQNLCYLDFEAGDEEGDDYGFAPEKSLDIFADMPKLKNINLGAKTYRRMTAGHADQIMQKRISFDEKARDFNYDQKFFGVPLKESIPFVQRIEMQLYPLRLSRFVN